MHRLDGWFTHMINGSGQGQIKKRILELEQELSERVHLKDVLLQSKDLFLTLLAMLPATLCLQAPDYTITFANQLFKENFGDPQDRPCYEMLHGRSAPCEECLPLEVMKTGNPATREWPGPNGRHYLVYYYPYEDAQGERLVLEMGFDVSDLRHTKASLEESEERFRVITDQSMLGIAIMQNGSLVYVNQAIADMCGYPVEELLSWKPEQYLKMFHPDDLSRVMEQARKKQAGDKKVVVKYEWRMVTATQEVTWIESFSKTVSLQGGPADMVILADVTERRRLEEERATREANMKDFLDIASHELRHPITILKGYTSMLMEGGDQLDEAERREIYGILEHGSNRLSGLVNGLLDISRIDRGRFNINREVLRLPPLINDALKAMHASGFDNPLNLHVTGDARECIADGEKLRELLVILLENAIKYSDVDSPVDVEVVALGGDITVSVLDRGIGIPEDAREHVFERFFQVEEAAHHSTPGMGMGLYIAYHIVSAHGGRIWCEQRAGGGTIMSFTLPQ